MIQKFLMMITVKENILNKFGVNHSNILIHMKANVGVPCNQSYFLKLSLVAYAKKPE